MTEPFPSLVRQESMAARLRAATRTAHEDIETVPALVRLLTADLTEADYIAVLRQTCAFHLGVEQQLKAVLAPELAPGVFLDGTRISALAVDLDWFGVPLPAPAFATALPVLPNQAHALGAMYVIEGSSLGGRVIARRLSDTLGLTPRTGSCFYSGNDAAATRDRWLRFCDLLQDTAARSDAIAADMAGGAVATFRSLDAWLRRTPIALAAVAAAAA